MHIQIRQYQFPISEPFAEGHKLTVAEARALNMYRADRIRRILWRKVELAVASLPEGTLLAETHLGSLRAEAKRIDEAYSFSAAGNGYREKTGTIEVEARRLVEDLGGLSEEEVKAKALDPKILEEARIRVEARSRIAAAALLELL